MQNHHRHLSNVEYRLIVCVIVLPNNYLNPSICRRVHVRMTPHFPLLAPLSTGHIVKCFCCNSACLMAVSRIQHTAYISHLTPTKSSCILTNRHSTTHQLTCLVSMSLQVSVQTTCTALVVEHARPVYKVVCDEICPLSQSTPLHHGQPWPMPKCKPFDIYLAMKIMVLLMTDIDFLFQNHELQFNTSATVQCT